MKSFRKLAAAFLAALMLAGVMPLPAHADGDKLIAQLCRNKKAALAVDTVFIFARQRVHLRFSRIFDALCTTLRHFTFDYRCRQAKIQEHFGNI